jgi:NAD(P)-dependent dehydrogenase (short-subunit alcohol dehydrogenase family)
MDLALRNKHVVITGGSKGIGFSCAKLYLEEGARVTLISRSQENLDVAKKELSALGEVHIYAGDLVKTGVVNALINDIESSVGPIDILVNSAGAAKRTPAFELTEEAWHDAMNAKFFTYIHVMNAVLPLMAKRHSGVVVNVIGMGGKVATTIHIAGGAANAALMLATAGLAQAYGPKNIRVVAVNPGLTMTERLKEGIQAEARYQGSTPEEALQAASSKMLLGRIAEPEEIADTVVYLSSNRASYVNGTTLAMDGGNSSAL